MRDRLIVAFVALTLAVVAVLMVVLGYATSQRVHAEERQKAERSAEVMASLLGSLPQPVTSGRLQSLLYDGERVVFQDADGRRVVASNPASSAAGEPTGGEAADDVTATRPVAGGGRVVLSLREDVVDTRVADALLPIVLVSLVLAALAGVVAAWVARRLSRPFRELAEVAEAIGRGDYDVAVPGYRVPEADTVARVLRVSAADLAALTGRERDFAAHASHALRTPITAARLELEDLAIAPGTPPEVVARLEVAVQQLDRLSATVAGMLEVSRDRMGTNGDIDLAALVRDAASRWQEAGGRRVVADCDTVVPVRLPVGSLVQVMDVLLGNALAHGDGTVTVSVSKAKDYAEVRVADGGRREGAATGMRLSAQDGAGSLATASEIAESLGGRMRLTDDSATTFSLVLPLPRRETVAP